MNLDKYIKIQLMILSKKYDISIVEIINAKHEKISKSYTVHIKNNETLERMPREEFKNKKQLVSWLMCLK